MMTSRQNPLDAANLDDLLARLNAPIGAVHAPFTLPPIQSVGYLVLVACFALVYLYASIGSSAPAPEPVRSQKPRVYRRAAMVDVYRPLGRRRGRWARQ